MTKIGFQIDYSTDGELRPFCLTLYFDENTKVKFVELAAGYKGG